MRLGCGRWSLTFKIQWIATSGLMKIGLVGGVDRIAIGEAALIPNHWFKGGVQAFEVKDENVCL
jgi:hypothetical protein